MSDFEIALPDGRSIVVDAPDAQQAAKAARMYLSKEKGQGDAKGSYADNLAKAAGQGATFGFGDEITAGVRAALPGLSNWMMDGNQTVSNAPTFGGRYEEELARERSKGRQFEQDNPKSAIAANVGGAVASTATTLPAALFKGTTLIGSALRSGATGGTLGAATGFGEGEGGPEKRLASALTHGVLGAGVGAAFPVAGSLVSAGVNKFGPPAMNKGADLIDAIAPKTPARSLSAAADGGNMIPQDGLLTRLSETLRSGAGNIEEGDAIRRLALELDRSGGVDAAGNKLTALGDQAFIADTSKGAERLANLGYIMPGQAPGKYKAAFDERAASSPQRMISAFEGAEPPPSTFQLAGAGQGFDSNVRAVGQRAYSAMDEAGLKQSPQMMALYENPEISGAIDRILKADKAARVGRPDAQPMSAVEVMHAVKQEIQDLGFDKMSGKPLATQQLWRDLSTDFVKAFKAANPAAAEADMAYAQAKSLSEFFDTGYGVLARGANEKAMNVSAPGIADRLEGATGQQAAALKAGATNAVRDTTETAADVQRLARRLTESDPLRARLGQVYGQPQADEITKRAGIERTFAETRGRVTSGSDTAQRVASMADDTLTAPGGSPASPASLVQMLVGKYNEVRQPSERMRSVLADYLANPDAAANQQVLARAREILERRRLSSTLAPGAANAIPAGGNP